MSNIAEMFRRLVARAEVDRIARETAVLEAQEAAAAERELAAEERLARIDLKDPGYTEAVSRRRRG